MSGHTRHFCISINFHKNGNCIDCAKEDASIKRKITNLKKTGEFYKYKKCKSCKKQFNEFLGLYCADCKKRVENYLIGFYAASNPPNLLKKPWKTNRRQVKLSKGLRSRLFVLQNGLCACCEKPLGEKFHFDHIVPVSKGGSDDDSNIQLLTAKCNMEKRAMDPIDFMQKNRGKLI